MKRTVLMSGRHGIVGRKGVGCTETRRRCRMRGKGGEGNAVVAVMEGSADMKVKEAQRRQHVPETTKRGRMNKRERQEQALVIAEKQLKLLLHNKDDDKNKKTEREEKVSLLKREVAALRAALREAEIAVELDELESENKKLSEMLDERLALAQSKKNAVDLSSLESPSALPSKGMSREELEEMRRLQRENMALRKQVVKARRSKHVTLAVASLEHTMGVQERLLGDSMSSEEALIQTLDVHAAMVKRMEDELAKAEEEIKKKKKKNEEEEKKIEEEEKKKRIEEEEKNRTVTTAFGTSVPDQAASMPEADSTQTLKGGAGVEEKEEEEEEEEDVAEILRQADEIVLQTQELSEAVALQEEKKAKSALPQQKQQEQEQLSALGQIAETHKKFFSIPKHPRSGDTVHILYNKKSCPSLQGAKRLCLQGCAEHGEHGDIRARLHRTSLPVKNGAEWYSVSLRLQEKVSDLSFCVLDLDNSNEMDCNDGDNFSVRVDRGVSERAMKKAREEVVDLMRSEQGIAEDLKNAFTGAGLLETASTLGLDAEDAKIALGHLGFNSAVTSLDLVRTTNPGVWYAAKRAEIGKDFLLFYNRSSGPLNDGKGAGLAHSPALTAHIGFNGWSHSLQLEARLLPAKISERIPFDYDELSPASCYDFGTGVACPHDELNQWYYFHIREIPLNALTVNFVFTDNANNWDNNNGDDFHVAITPRAQRDSVVYWNTLLADKVKEIEEEREERRRVEAKRKEERAKRRRAMREKSENQIRKQQMKTLRTVPALVQAGSTIEIHYNPRNTPLEDSFLRGEEIYLIGGYNRWTHPRKLSTPRRMVRDDTSPWLCLAIDIPDDAYMLDLVFTNRPSSGDGGDATYDNRSKMDYHITVHNPTVTAPPLHVVNVSVEMAPIAKVGGLGDVVTSLGRAVQELGHVVDVILPKYDVLDYSIVKDMKELDGFHWGGTYTKVYQGSVEGLRVSFLEPENNFFSCGMIYGADWEDIPMTDSERFGFFSKAALEYMLQVGMKPDIIHCHDWSTAPVARSYWEDYSDYGLGGAKVCFTIHNLGYGADLIQDAINMAQFSTTVSPSYAREIAGHPAVTAGIERGSFFGILNGIDPDIWDPSNDALIPKYYTSSTIVSGKEAAKQSLRHRLGLVEKEGVPLVGCVTRLTQQKGVHLIKHAIRTALERGCQVVLLGSAFDPDMQRDFDHLKEELRRSHYDMAALHFTYDEPLSHLIYAASDMLLVPSIFEPCGLSQLIAMRYGTVPVVRKTGGLNDTVFDVEHDVERAKNQMLEPNGYNFEGTDEGSVDYALNRAISLYYDNRASWIQLASRVMEQDWSWNKPAHDYIEMYHAAKQQ